MAIDYNERIPNNVELSDNRTLQRALERWQLAFPVAFTPHVRRYAEENDLDPFLVLAIMRHESGFNPKAVSRSDAGGLMQLILPTARLVAKNLLGEAKPKRLWQLFDPERNIRLGTRFFRHVLDKVGDNAALAAAGYNAGSGAIRTWRNRWGHLDTDELVEEIPYKQARGYTKQVVQAWGTYRYLYGPVGDERFRGVPLPRKVRPTADVALGGSDEPATP